MRLWLCVALTVGNCVCAFGDGKVFGGRDFWALYPIGQREQRAAIVHRDGIEKLIIAINIELAEKDKALWIFPVPGTPEGTKLDVVDSFPRFSGRDPRQPAGNAIGQLMMAVRATQIYPLIFEAVFMTHLGTSRVDASVHTHVEKWGIRSEAITADSLDSLVGYLQEKKAGVQKEELSVFEPYLSGQYVLVVAWIASREELLKKFPEYGKRGHVTSGRWPCLYVEFPTERAFYPLRPTSGYGDDHIPVNLFVVDTVRPEAGAALAGKMRVGHFRQRAALKGAPREFSESLPEGAFLYTSVRITTEARDLTEDLWFEPVVPLRLRYAEAVESMAHPAFGVPLGIALVAVLSYVAAGVSGVLLYGQWKGYARLGLWNLLTLVGLVLAIRHVPGERGEKLRSVVTRRGRPTTKFWHLFTVLYLVLAVALHLALLGPLSW